MSQPSLPPPDLPPQSHTISAFSIRKHTLGVAVYYAETGTLLVGKDVLEEKTDNGVRAAEKVRLCTNVSVDYQGRMEKISISEGRWLVAYQVASTHILTPSSTDERLLTIINDESPSAQIIHPPAQQFNLRPAMQKLQDLPMFDTCETLNKKTLALMNFVDLDSAESIGCAGAIIGHLNRNTLDRDRENALVVTTMALIGCTRDHYMQMSSNSASDLGIFANEAHPSKGLSRSRESISLYTILDHTSSSGGSATLKSWLKSPLQDLEEIQYRQNMIGLFVDPDNKPYIHDLRRSLKSLGNLPKALRNFGNNTCRNVQDWNIIMRFMSNFVNIITTLEKCAGLERVRALRAKIMALPSIDELMQLGMMINDTINFEESTIEHRVRIRQGVDIELDQLKTLYAGLDDLLSVVAQEIASEMPNSPILSLNVVFFPQLGFLVAIPYTEGLSRNALQECGFELQFSTDATIYFKTARVRELDQQIGDVHSQIADKELERAHSLAAVLMTSAKQFLAAHTFACELDCILSLAHVSWKNSYVCPEMFEDFALEIKQGRNPVYESSMGSSFIPNDTKVRSHDGKYMQMLTGPNYSGKSVYLKQIGLIVVLAHIGCWVPASRAKIGLFNKIFTRMQTRETVSGITSSFMIDLHQISTALRYSTPRSLLLIDEPFQGTNTADGVGLFCGLLHHLAARPEGMPAAFIATHFHEVFLLNLLPRELPIHAVTMKIVQSDKEIRFLYKVVDGMGSDSAGIHCAMMAGISKPILYRALEASAHFARFEWISPPDDLSSHMSSERDGIAKLCQTFLRLDRASMNSNVPHQLLAEYEEQNRSETAQSVSSEMQR